MVPPLATTNLNCLWAGFADHRVPSGQVEIYSPGDLQRPNALLP
jgi:hypothetical protein